MRQPRPVEGVSWDGGTAPGRISQGRCPMLELKESVVDAELGFLGAIRESPDDIGSRLVYADWLEEKGDPRHQYLRLISRLSINGCRGVGMDDRSIYKQLLPLQDGICY